MKVYRINLTGWTSSFRYPNMISGYQPTLVVPPLSTIMGLISAAKGDAFHISTEKIGYVFRYSSKNTDLETIYQKPADKNKDIKSNVIKREFLHDIDLYLYTDSQDISGYLSRPVFQLLLGRSGDLVSVKSIMELDIVEKEELSNVKGTLIPFKRHQVAAPLQALPVDFSNEIPRKNIDTQPYYIIDYQSRVAVNAKGFTDTIDKNTTWDVYWQEI
ncbi:MAG: type I-B CRISPR-associated protein Cas5b [Candidatus Cloacimonetes bacterium]|nr:type I-B CRISPR-associated protein Cas5b [Candidatus Cloacimonadota bacterium]